MRIRRYIDFGTERYPEKIARRLRAMNIAALIVAGIAGSFAIRRLLDPAGDKLQPGLINAAGALFIAAIPLLNRFSPLAGPLTLAAFIYAFIFWIVSVGGTGGGAWLGYLAAVPLLIVLLGAERFLLTGILGAFAAGMAIVVHLLFPANTGYVSPQSLFYGNFVFTILVSTALLYAVVQYAMRQIDRAEAIAAREYERSESLLLNILPASIAARLKTRTEPVIADTYPEASILFADMAGFTVRAGKTAPEELVRFLNDVFTQFDELVEKHGLEKIKTTGDAYMVVSGVPVSRPDHAAALAAFALEMRDAAATLRDPLGQAVPMRIGIGSGPVVAGVIGKRKIFYDVWGDAVNVASRMESTGEVGLIQISQATRERLDDTFIVKMRHLADIKGKGPMVTWLLLGRRQQHPTLKHSG